MNRPCLHDGVGLARIIVGDVRLISHRASQSSVRSPSSWSVVRVIDRTFPDGFERVGAHLDDAGALGDLMAQIRPVTGEVTETHNKNNKKPKNKNQKNENNNKPPKKPTHLLSRRNVHSRGYLIFVPNK